jgi:hypothetical protein
LCYKGEERILQHTVGAIYTTHTRTTHFTSRTPSQRRWCRRSDQRELHNVKQPTAMAGLGGAPGSDEPPDCEQQ